MSSPGSFEVLSYDNPEDRQKWRSICQSFKEIDIFYYPEYVHLFERKGDGKAHCFVYYEGGNGIVIYPFLKRRINELPIFHDISDNLTDIISPYGYSGYLRNISAVNMNNFINNFHNYCSQNNIVSEFIRFHPILNNFSYCSDNINIQEWNETVVVDLSLSTDNIWKDMSPSCRNKVKKAGKNHVEIIHDRNFEHLNKFYELYTDTMKRLQAQEYYFFSKSWFKELIELLPNNVALFHGVCNSSIIMSGIFIFNRDFIHYFLSGSIYEMRHVAANNLLLHEVSIWAKNEGIKWFHLGGGYQQDDSLYRFKASFSRLRYPFCIGNVIHDSDCYHYLTRRRESSASKEPIGWQYFPAYRAPIQKSAVRIKKVSKAANNIEVAELFNILFANVGRRVALIQAFRETMTKLKLQGRILGVDANPLSPAYYVTDQSFPICHIQDDNYISLLLEICQREQVRILISLIDTDLLKLAESRERFQEKGIFVLISAPEVIYLSRNKHLTRKFFQENGILTPRILSFKEALEENHFPLFIKPIDGSASLLTFRIDNQESLRFFNSYVPSPILQEFIPGDEYTLDVFINLAGQVQAVVPRKRLEVRAGEVSKSQIVLNQKILMAGYKVAEALAKHGGLGVINVQCIYTPEGEVKFIEINPRFGGGSPLSIYAGYPFPQWILEMVLGRELSPLPADLGNGLTMLRYDDSIIIRQ